MSRITRKGQVTIPKRLRDHLGLVPGAAVSFEVAQGEVFLRAAKPAACGDIAALRGSAGPSMTTDEIMALTRGEDALGA